MLLLNAHAFVCDCTFDPSFIIPETVIDVLVGVMVNVETKNLDSVAYIHNSTTFPVVVAASMEKVTNATLS